MRDAAAMQAYARIIDSRLSSVMDKHFDTQSNREELRMQLLNWLKSVETDSETASLISAALFVKSRT